MTAITDKITGFLAPLNQLQTVEGKFLHNCPISNDVSFRSRIEFVSIVNLVKLDMLGVEPYAEGRIAEVINCA